MDALISFLVLSFLPRLVVPDVPTSTSYRAIVEIVSGKSRIFTGERLHLRCIIPDVYKVSWDYLWFRGSVQLPWSGEVLQLWNANIKESGKYFCQGKRETQVGSIKTQRSLPEEIHVDGGFVILQTPQHPILVGDVLDFECRLRGKAPVQQTILYRDGVEVMVQSGSSLNFHLANVTLADEGMYSCRASWDLSRCTHSVISAATPVNILEVLTQPVLEIDAEGVELQVTKINLICHLQYNARAPAPPVNYYFYKNNNLLGPSTSLNHINVRQAPGWYSCKAKVPRLDIIRWSEPKRFGKVTGLHLMPPDPHHRNQMSSSPSKSPPHISLAPATQPATPKPFAATPSFNQHTEGSEQSSMHSELPVPTSLPPPDQFPGQTKAPKP
ncbi:Fc receptor-like A [Girardinichthys multiradiatus]|uniref:Fc receptor-like A n=1 Tax=Girardinichthys multiradiatus TaxID=208333 RepID=UPI001FAE216E|nr:Fc receptor-like A [Girardinichthys multiradiatus]